MPDISIIIINYNTFKLTCECIDSVISNTKAISYEIILVDNASTEVDPGKFLEKFPQIKLIKSDRNGGFAYGNNLGLKKASGRYILLLNSDTLLKEDSVSICFNYLVTNNRIGVLGCRMVYPSENIQYTARKFRSVGWELLDLFRFIPLLMSYPIRSKKMLGKYFRHDEDIFCDWINGAFFMIPATVISQLPGGQFDESFFMYGEDQLWCEQVRKLGYTIAFTSRTTIIHINSGSTVISKQIKLRKTMQENELKIMELRRGRGAYFSLFKFIYLLKEGIRNFVKTLYYKLTGKLIR